MRKKKIKRKPITNEQKTKLIFQQAKKLKKIHILKYALYKNLINYYKFLTLTNITTSKTITDIIPNLFSPITLTITLYKWEKIYENRNSNRSL